jgi:nitric oxide reductase large subunit
MENHDLIQRQRRFRCGLAYTYVLRSAFWNFVGAGVFGGGAHNAPLVNYYEHGTPLTLNHAHASLFGAFGMLAIGLIYFLPALCGRRARCHREARAYRILALQCRAGSMGRAQFLSGRLAATRHGL